MPYTPNNNPYVPGDPYAYDLKYFLDKIRTTESTAAAANTAASNAVSTANSAASVAASAQSAATNAVNTANQAATDANAAKFSVIPQLGIRAYFAGVDADHPNNTLVWIKAPLGASQGEILTSGDLRAYMSRYTDGTGVNGLNPCVAKVILIGCPLFSGGQDISRTIELFNPQITYSEDVGANYFELCISGIIKTDSGAHFVTLSCLTSQFNTFTFNYISWNDI